MSNSKMEKMIKKAFEKITPDVLEVIIAKIGQRKEIDKSNERKQKT